LLFLKSEDFRAATTDDKQTCQALNRFVWQVLCVWVYARDVCKKHLLFDTLLDAKPNVRHGVSYVRT